MSSIASLQQFWCKICEIKKRAVRVSSELDTEIKTTKIKLLTVRNPNTSHAEIFRDTPGNIEVRNLGMKMTLIVPPSQNVLWLDVSMDDSLRMEMPNPNS